MDLQGIGWGEAGSGLMGWDRDKLWALVKVVLNLQVPKNVENFLISSGIVTFSRRTVLRGVSFVCVCSLKKTLEGRDHDCTPLYFVLNVYCISMKCNTGNL